MPATGTICDLMTLPVIALEHRLQRCRNVRTLGVRANFGDYSAEERRLIREAPTVYYPSPFYADLLDSMGKRLFPSYHTYKCVQDKIKQTAMFQLLQVPHPRTRVYYGRRQKSRITEDFDFPLVGKIPRGSALGRGVFLIRDRNQLARYCRPAHPAYIQEYLPLDRDIRVVVVGQRVVHAYWRVAAPGEFRSNLGAGGRVELENVPPEAVALALETARRCGWNDVGLDIVCHEGRYLVLEGNMKYGKEGFRRAGIDYVLLMEEMIANGDI
jgi:ribosomal protein S6--L-glutamate ligase